jgi:hypothetical protein
LTCVALLGGSLRPEKYASRARSSAPDDPHVPRRKNNRLGPCDRRLHAKAMKKGATKPEKAFLRKEKRMRFAATRRWKMTVEGPTNKGKSFSVGLVQSRGKLHPMDSQELFRVISEYECSACPSGLFIIIVHPCLLHLQPVTANSRLRPPRTCPQSCFTSPLRSLLQLRVPLPSGRSILRCHCPRTAPAGITSFARSPQVRALPAANALPLPQLSRMPSVVVSDTASPTRSTSPPPPSP